MYPFPSVQPEAPKSFWYTSAGLLVIILLGLILLTILCVAGCVSGLAIISHMPAPTPSPS